MPTIVKLSEASNRWINSRLAVRYTLGDLAANAWCRDANAAIAAYWLSTRRGLAAPAHLQQQYDTYVALLDRIAAGHLRVPEAPESHPPGPSVSNFGPREARFWGGSRASRYTLRTDGR